MTGNTYICRVCGRAIATRCDDCGTTPFIIGCRATPGCKGFMESQFGRMKEGLTPTYEWYRMSDSKIPTMTSGECDHHLAGGAFLRKIETKRPKISPLLKRPKRADS